MNILLASHAPWRATGYGMPVETIARMLRSLGHQVVIMAVDSRGPGVVEWGGFSVVLPDKDPWGQDIIKDVVGHFDINVIVSFFDPWVLKKSGYSRKVSGAAWVGWFPVDQHPLPYDTAQLVSEMDLALVYSRYGLRVLTAEVSSETRRKAAYMPIPIDTGIFGLSASYPQPAVEERKAFGITDGAYVVGIVASNIVGDRKALAEQVQGFCEFKKDLGAERTVMLLNTEPFGAVNLPALLYECGASDSAIFISDYARKYRLNRHSELTSLYRACNVLLHASAAEGYGLCMLEAMACGTLVIYNDTTSMPELAEGVGIAVAEQVPAWSVHGGWWYRPTANGVCAALHKAHNFDYDPIDLNRRANQFSPEKVGEMWREVLENL